MTAITRAPEKIQSRLKDTFASLSIRNYRLYFIGQTISVSGTWMQTVAQGWLVLQLTGSGTQVGLVVALQFLPLLVVSPFGGMVADQFAKRSVLLITQTLLALLPLALGIVVLAGLVQVWMLYVFAGLLGLVNAIDNPTRQAFVSELVPRAYVRNAVTLNSTQVNLSRVVGPSIGAVLIATAGIGFCFIANAISSAAIIAALLCLHDDALQPAARAARGRLWQKLREGVAYVQRESQLADVLVLAAIVSTFAYEFQTTLPIFAYNVFGADAAGYAHLWVAVGMGAVLGGLGAANRKDASRDQAVLYAALFGVSLLIVSIVPTLSMAMLAMVLVGYFSINFTSIANTVLQLEAADAYRGRVLSLWTVAMLGSTPLGGPITGFVGEHAGGRAALALGGVAALGTAAYFLFVRRRR